MAISDAAMSPPRPGYVFVSERMRSKSSRTRDLTEPLTFPLALFAKNPKLISGTRYSTSLPASYAHRQAAKPTRWSSRRSISSATETGRSFSSCWAPPAWPAGCWHATARVRRRGTLYRRYSSNVEEQTRFVNRMKPRQSTTSYGFQRSRNFDNCVAPLIGHYDGPNTSSAAL